MFCGASSREATSSSNAQSTRAQFEHSAVGGPPAVDQDSSSPPDVAASKHERDIAAYQEAEYQCNVAEHQTAERERRRQARETAAAMVSLDQWQRTDADTPAGTCSERAQAAGRLADAPNAPPDQRQSVLESLMGVTCGVRLACDEDGEWEDDDEPSGGVEARCVGEPRTWVTLKPEPPCAPLRFGRFQRQNSSHHVGARTVAGGLA